MKPYFHLATLAFSLTAATAAPLTLQVTNAPGGTLDNNHLATRGDELFVTGSFDQAPGIEIPATAHVDVQLLAADGSVVAESRDDIDSGHPRLSQGRHGRVPFVVTFPTSQSGPAAVVHVTYHHAPHS